MLSNLTWVEGLIRKNQNLGIELLLTYKKLSKIDRSCDIHSVFVVNSHSIEIAVTIDSHQILVFGHIPKKAHTLEVPILENDINWKDKFIGQKFVKDRSK